MKHVITIKVPPSDIHNQEYLINKIKKECKLKESEKVNYLITKRSIDARKKNIYFVLRVEVYINEPLPVLESFLDNLPSTIAKGAKVIIVGAGPAGYFAALKLISEGIKPVVLDRGKDVRSRRRDLRAIQQDGEVNPDSNYCFGEGGAGTYSDGKLYTRAHKRGKIEEILNILIEHGANPDIRIDAHPHIGSNKLPGIVTNLRDTIIHKGGEVHFNTRVVDFNIHNGIFQSAIDQSGKNYHGEAMILATGHSARDIYMLLDKKDIKLERKPFALGVRIEHPQMLIDEIQYGQRERHLNLPASSYRIACQVMEKGVFSFCMCPGGLIVPTATAPGELVVNGMSLSRRDSPFANSGFVTSIDNDEMDIMGYDHLFGHLDFQKEVEQTFFQYGDGSQKAPAQRLPDFVKGRISTSLNNCSYIPGIYAGPVHSLLPEFVYQRLKKAIMIFDKKLKGYFTEEAQVVGVESRTSSPIRIPRNIENYMHDDVAGLFPCGEGAGYAGGILSAAMDGQNVANAVKSYVMKN